MKKNVVKILAAIIIIFVLLLIIFGIYRCPLNELFGIPCPLCGMTRAINSLISLNFKQSFYYHALWPVIIIGILIVSLSEMNIIKLSQKQKNIIVYFYIFIIVVYYVIRHITGSLVVKFDFEKSIVYKLLQIFK